MFKRLLCIILAGLLLCTSIPLATPAEALDRQDPIESTVLEVTKPNITVTEETTPSVTENSDSAADMTEPVETVTQTQTSQPESNATVAYNGTCGNNLTWKVAGSGSMLTLTISGTGPMYDYDSGAAPWYSHKRTISTLVIEEGVTYIGSGAFYDCNAIYDIYIPTTLEKTGSFCFYKCHNISRVHIKDLVAWCNIDFEDTPSSYGTHARLILNGTEVKDLVIPEGITQIKPSTFKRFGYLESVTFPSSVKKVGASSFNFCWSIQSLTIPETLTDIGVYAFSSCSSVKSIHIIGGGKQFGKGAFEGTTSLKEVHIDSLTDWCSNSFADTNANPTHKTRTLLVNGKELTELNLPDDVTRIGDGVFMSMDRFDRIVIPAGITSIGARAFSNCPNLTDVYIADSVTEIGNGAFMDCPNLITIQLPNELTEIASETFKNCTSLYYLDIPGKVMKISDSAFSGSALIEVYLPDTLTQIGASAFANCGELWAVFWPEIPPVVDETAFTGTSALFCYWEANAQWEAFTENKFGGNSTWYSPNIGAGGTFGAKNQYTWQFKDNTLTISGSGDMSDCTSTPWYPYRPLMLKAVISDGITGLCQNAFKECARLQEVTLPTGLKTIGKMAFAYTTFFDFTVPNGVTSLGDGVFEGCSFLQNVTLPSTLANIGSGVFAYCDYLPNIIFLGNMPDFHLSGSATTFDNWNGFVLYPNNNKTWTREKLDETEAFYVLNDRGASVLFLANDGTAVPQLRVEINYSTGEPLLVWNWIETADRYEIYRATSKTGTYTKVATVQQITWQDEDTTVGKTYYYKVKAICDADPSLNTGFSAVKSASRCCGTPTLTAEFVPGTGKIKLIWDKTSGAKTYEVYRCETPDGKYTKLTTTSATNYTDNKGGLGKLYFYKIRAVASNTSYKSEYSNIIYGYAICAAPNVKVTYQATTGKPILTWNKVTGAEDYCICRSIPGSTSYEHLITTSNTSYTDTTAKTDVLYTYTVEAWDYWRELDSCETTVTAVVSYAKPKLHEQVNINNKPRLSWDKITNAAGYNVYRSADSGNTYQFVGTATEPEYTDTSAKGGYTYYYKVSTLGKNSESALSASVSIPCPIDIPSITVKAGPTGKPEISWNKVTNAKKYEIWRSSDGINFTDIATTTSTSYTDKNASGGQYTYTVVAIASNSKYNSDFSTKGSCYVTCAAPNLTVNLNTKGKPSLTWNKVTGAVEYEIYRSKNGDAFTLLTTTESTNYLDIDAKPDNQYSYKLIALGKEEVTNSPESAVKTIAVTVGTPVIKGTVNDQGKPVISWVAVEDAVKYVVYRSTSSSKNYKEIDTITELTYEDTSVTAGKTYYYKLEAVGENSKSAQSAYVKLTGKCGIPELNVEAGSTGKPVLTWNKVAGAKKYEIWRSVDGAAFKKLTTATKTTYTDTQATNGAECIYKVKALGSKSSYNGLFSAEQGCYVICAAPTLTAKIDTATGKPSLSWSKVTGATGYDIYRSENGSGFEKLTNVTDTTYLDEATKADNRYTYYIVSVGKAEVFNSVNSAEKTVTVTVGQPKLVGSIDEQGKAVITWQAVEDALKYEVYRSTSSSKSYKLVDTVTELTYTDTGITAGKTYYYKVVAVGSNSKSAQSAYVKLTGACAQPVINVQIDETSGKPVIGWGKISGAKKYEIYRSTDGVKFSKLTTTTKLIYTDSKATVGTEYTYKVKAVGSKSSYNSIDSTVLTATAKCAMPVVTLKIDAVTGKPTLTWKAVSGATEYGIYFDDGEGYSLINVVEDTKFTHEDAYPGRICRYYVVAYGTSHAYDSAWAKTGTVAATCGQPKLTGTISITGKPELSWNAVENATGYVIYRSTSSSKNYRKIDTTTDLTYTDTTAAKNKTYYYKLTAVSEGSESAQSNYCKLKAKK